MKYKKSFFTNLIAIILVIALSACSSGDESSGVPSDVSENDVSFTVETARQLIEADKKVIEIFACNSLCASDAPVGYKAVSEGHEYRAFDKILSLISSVYAKDGGQTEMLLSYPLESAPSVRNADGVTNVFRHPSVFDDFIATDSVSVADTENENRKSINAKTASGREVTLTAVFENGKWLLEKSLLSVIPSTKAFDKKPLLSDKGSMADFSGNVLVINFFISDKNYTFLNDSDEEEAEFASRVATAVDWLVAETERCGGEVNVTYENADFDHAGNIGNGDLAFDIVFSETGFGTLQKFAEENYDLTQYDNYLFAVCFNKECDNLFKACDGGSTTEIYYGERLFVGTNTTPEDICRMALGVLGAYDYRSGERDKYTESLYQAYFPNDIMAGGTLDKSSVTPVTAYTCGMVEGLPELYQIFINTQDNQEQSEEN